MPDFTLQNEGSIFILTPHTGAAKGWAAEHIPDDAMQWGDGIIIEHRYVEPIVDAIFDDGLECQ